MLRPGILLLGLTLTASVAGTSAAQEVGPIETPAFQQELMDELKNNVPHDNKEREGRLVDLFKQAQGGVAAQLRDEIRLLEVKGKEGAGQPKNVVVRKKGTSDSVIVVGGHYDKVPRLGDGVIDDWSGACLATNLYQTLKPFETQHTFIFIGFAFEEDGLLGSRSYVDSLSAAERKKIVAMVNLECLGVDDPLIWTNGSTDSLEDIARRVARRHNLPLGGHDLDGVDADSSPFRDAGIPSITIDGLPENTFGLIHSNGDKASNIREEAYLNAYRLIARYLITLDEELPGARSFVEPPKPSRPFHPQAPEPRRQPNASFEAEAPAQKIILVRHGERADDSRDSPLSDDGFKRAAQLADLLEFDGIVAIYRTQYQRTRQTAQPLSDRTGVRQEKVELTDDVVNGGQSAWETWAKGAVRTLRAAHPEGNVLVVGHRETVPLMIRELCPAVSPFEIPRDEYNNLFVVILKGGRQPKLIKLKY